MPFRISPIPILGYYAGSFVLASLCVISGQLTIAVAFIWNRRFIEENNCHMVQSHNASMKALAAQSKDGFTMCNKVANDAFGKVFFSQIALSAASLWPIPFAIGWMQNRFSNVVFDLPVRLPGIGDNVGFLFTFLPIYVLTFIIFKNIKKRLPLFNRVSAMIDKIGQKDGEKFIGISDLSTLSSSKS